jgi:hydroxyacylglutathione hydrolase
MDGNKFETWLGSIIRPQEPFYLAAENMPALHRLIARAASIGYETQIVQGLVIVQGPVTEPAINISMFSEHPDHYTIVDVRNDDETKDHPIFKNSLSIPLAELRNRLDEIPSDKPIAVHCAGGYRSAAGSSIISAHLSGLQKVYDIGEAIKDFEQK